MMIKRGRAGATAEELVKMFLCGGPQTTLAASARERQGTVGKTDGTDFRKFQMILKKAAVQGETGDFRRVLQASELFLFDGEQDAPVVQQRDGRALA